MKSRLLSACAALALLCPGYANATASEAAGFTWTGMYVGINAGYGMGASDWDFQSGSSNDQDLDGGIIGLQAGYNAQLVNGLVAGIEISTEATNIGGDNRCSGLTCATDIASVSDVSGRLGVNWGTSMLYGKGGLAYQNLRHGISGSQEDKSGSMGYIAGAGVEFYVDGNVTAKVEYNYFSFNDDGAAVGASRFDSNTSLQLVKAGLNLKFN